MEDRPEPGLSIVAEVDPLAGEVRFEYTIASGDVALPPRLRIAFPHRWAGRDDLGDDIRGVRVTDAAGVELPTTIGMDGVAVITTGDAHVVLLHYAVHPDRRILTHATRFRALHSADRFYAPGLAALALPLDLGASMTDAVRWTSVCDDPTWCLRATVSTDEPLPLRELADAAFFAGKFDRVSRDRHGRTITVWVEERLDARAHGLADLTMAVVDAQAELLAEAATETRVVALLREDDTHALNGSGRSGGFVLELGADVEAADPTVAELVAHENLHRLNGHTLRYASVDEFATMWFREGVTDYAALRNAAAHGIVARQRFFGLLGRALANYYGSPSRGVVSTEIGERFWVDRDLRRLPYDKGALIGLLMDLELRDAGAGDVEGLLAFLRDEAAETGLPVTNSSLRDAVERYSGIDWAEFWAAYVLGGDTLPVFERLNAVGLEVVERVEPAPYFGFRTSVTVDGGWYVSSVEVGSPADGAGLQTGMALLGEPYVPEGPTPGDAVLELSTARGARRVAVPSGRGQRRTFALTAADDAYLSAFGL